MSVLELTDIRKSFDGVGVLKGVSLSVERGESIAVIGRSGSGKSTLLRCAALIERIDAGRIKYDDDTAAAEKNGAVEYASKEQLRQIKRRFGMVFQSFNLFPHMNVLQNLIDAPVAVQKRDRGEMEEKAAGLLDKLGLSDKARSYPCTLSGGQQQRVGIARALMNDPEIMYFDEPTSALDPELTGEVLATIKMLAAQKMTMVIVTHEIEFAKNVADRAVFMDEGAIVEQGPARQLLTAPQQQRTAGFLKNYLMR